MAVERSAIDLLPVHGVSWKGVRYGCTTRRGGASGGPWASFNLGLHAGDDPGAVHENRRRLAAALSAEPFWLEQVHGTHVADADEPGHGTVPAHCPVPGESERHAGRDVDELGHGTVPAHCSVPGESERHAGRDVDEPAGAAPPRADAAVTTTPGRVLAIMTADCAPVVIADLQGRALGVAHAGWRGLAAGVLEATLAALKARLPAAAGWRAWVGPCIGQDRFEVGDEVRRAIVGGDAVAERYFAPGRAPGKWQADLAGLARHRLETMGIYSVETSGLCTHDRGDLFYSYRRSAITGRMATVAWIEAGPQTQ